MGSALLPVLYPFFSSSLRQHSVAPASLFSHVHILFLSLVLSSVSLFLSISLVFCISASRHIARPLRLSHFFLCSRHSFRGIQTCFFFLILFRFCGAISLAHSCTSASANQESRIKNQECMECCGNSPLASTQLALSYRPEVSINAHSFEKGARHWKLTSLRFGEFALRSALALRAARDSSLRNFERNQTLE